MFIKEEIPDIDFLYCRVAKGFYSPKTCLPRESAFVNSPKDGDNLSCDWNKYATPEFTNKLVAKQRKMNGLFKDPANFFVYKFNVGEIRNITILKQKIEHDPIFFDPEQDGNPNNQAHSIIIGDKGDDTFTELRLKMVDLGEWALKPDDCLH